MDCYMIFFNEIITVRSIDSFSFKLIVMQSWLHENNPKERLRNSILQLYSTWKHVILLMLKFIKIINIDK